VKGGESFFRFFPYKNSYRENYKKYPSQPFTEANGPSQTDFDTATLGPGIPCNKAEGVCSLKTGKETFSCVCQPEERLFFKGMGSV
jgi:hypothetical protein